MYQIHGLSASGITVKVEQTKNTIEEWYWVQVKIKEP